MSWARSSSLVALAASVLALLAAGCGLEVGDDDAEATTTTTAPPEEEAASGPPVVVGAPVVMEELVPGDCFNHYQWDEDGRRIEVTTRVACTEPHHGEVYHSTQYPAPFGTPYPGDDAMRRYAQGTCYRAFEAFIGVRYEVSKFTIGVVTPNQSNFEDERARYRGITCYVEQPGEVLTGSARGSSL